jgi:hypothetical protein
MKKSLNTQKVESQHRAVVRSVLALISLLILSSCGGGGGGGGGISATTGSTPPTVITNQYLLPEISRAPAALSLGTSGTTIFINEQAGRRHDILVTDVINRLHPHNSVLVTTRPPGRLTETVFYNYYAQPDTVVTSTSQGFNEPFIQIQNLDLIAARDNIDYNTLGLQVLAAGNDGISFTTGLGRTQHYDRAQFLDFLARKRTIIAIGMDGEGRRHSSSNYCESWYSQYCVAASYYYETQSGENVQGTSFSTPIIAVAAAVMKEQFSLTPVQTFEITTHCAGRNPGPHGAIGAINLECMFKPDGTLYASLDEVINAPAPQPSRSPQRTVGFIAASIPPTPGATAVQIPSVYDRFGRNFGAMTFDRQASFKGSPLPALENRSDQVVAQFDNANMIVRDNGDYPLVGLKFHNGISIDGAMGDTFFGINHDVYKDTKSLRLGYEIGKPDLGLRFHYLRQQAEGNEIFNKISGHAWDSELHSSVNLDYGKLEMSLRHDVFLEGSYHFLGRAGEMDNAESTSIRMGYILDF